MTLQYSTRLFSALIALAAITIGVPAATSTRGGATQAVSGTLRIIGQAAGAGAASAAVHAIVYAEPLDTANLLGTAPKRPGTFKLTQKGKAFVPRLLVVPTGSTVDFPNDDLIFHNVFSVSTPSPFDLGLYRAGASKSQTFTAPATYRVFCNIHPQMTALIAVVPTGYIVNADANGAFTLDVPPGRYRVTAVSERGATVTQEMRVAGAAAPEPLRLTLDESQAQTSHKNKFGQDYPKDAWGAK
jgi:plastocyanin